MSFYLPEEDQEYLTAKGIQYELLVEKVSGGQERRGVIFHGFPVPPGLRIVTNGSLANCECCDLLVIVPHGYATTKLDSFYASPYLKRFDGTDPRNATGQEVLFGATWQFWSRHLADSDWRVGIDGFSTYLQYITSELRNA
jgi:hypothetical protein